MRKPSKTESVAASPQITIALVNNDGKALDELCGSLRHLSPHWKIECHPEPLKAATALSTATPSAVVIALGNRSLTGFACLRRLRASCPGLPIIVATDDAEITIDCVMAGASGFLMLPATAGVLLNTLRRAVRGETLLSKGTQERLIKHIRNCSRRASELLSPREQEIMEWLALGPGEKEIACELGITYSTLHAHLESIYRKLRVHNRTEAVRKYLGLATP